MLVAAFGGATVIRLSPVPPTTGSSSVASLPELCSPPAVAAHESVPASGCEDHDSVNAVHFARPFSFYPGWQEALVEASTVFFGSAVKRFFFYFNVDAWLCVICFGLYCMCGYMLLARLLFCKPVKVCWVTAFRLPGATHRRCH